MNAKTLVGQVVPNDKRDWLMILRTTWPVVVAVILVAFWAGGGRMETPSEKTTRIKLLLAPLEVRMSAIEDRITGAMAIEAENQRRVIDLFERYLESLERDLPKT